MSKGNKTFICKPREGCQGAGIVIVKKFRDLPSFVVNSTDYVVQEYIENPMLIGGKKFDLRVYVLVTDLGNSEGQPLISFVSEEALVRFCTEDYAKPSSSNMHNLLSHLTNYSLNKNSDKFVEEDIDAVA